MSLDAGQAASQFVDDQRIVAVVTTTVRVPHFLMHLLASAAHHGHAETLHVIVVGDRRTPDEVGEYLELLGKRYPSRVTYLDVAAQRRLMRRWPMMDLVLRWDCVQRRNVGYLAAALQGAEVVISVDDDNFVTGDDFIGCHLAVGREIEVPVVSHPSGWWNVCERLVAEPDRRFYPRGYPKSRQDWNPEGQEVCLATMRIAANAGLWLGSPDLDATGHLEEPIRVVNMMPVAQRMSCALAPGTWCPINSQNTAFDISALPAMYLPVMQDFVGGWRIGRMDDVWMGYFLRAIADGRQDAVLYGPPLVSQERNPHDFLTDLTQELPGYLLTERLVEYLRGFCASRADRRASEAASDDTLAVERYYQAAYLDLIYHVRESAETDDKLDAAGREYLRQLTLGMAAWHQAVADILEEGR